MDEQSELAQLKSKFDALELRVKLLEKESLSEEWPAWDMTDKIFVEMLQKIEEPYSLQRLIRETSLEAWAKAAVTLPQDLLVKIRNNISAHNWDELTYFAHEVENQRTITSHRQEILRMVRKEEECGFILVHWAENPYLRFFHSVLLDVPAPPTEEEIKAQAKAKKELKDWFDRTLAEITRIPRKRPVDTSGIEV